MHVKRIRIGNKLSSDDNKSLDFSNCSSDFMLDDLEDGINKILNYGALKKIAEAVKVPFPPEHEINNIIYRIASLIINFQIDQNINDMADAVRNDIELQRCLLIIVKSSGMYLENISSIRTIAARAITILNAAKVSFSKMDLSNICVPGSNLRYAIMSGTNLQGSDLQDVVLADAFLKGVNLSKCNLQDVNFLQKPYLLGHGNIRAMAWCPERQWLFCATEINDQINGVQVIGLSEEHPGDIISYAAQTCRSKDKIIGLALDSSGTTLITIHYGFQIKNKFCIWEISHSQAGLIIKKLRERTINEELKSVSIHPNRRIVVIGSFSRCVIYDLINDNMSALSFGDETFANSTAFSNDGSMLAFVTDFHDPKLYLYDGNSYVFQSKINFEEGCDLTKVIFSPDDRWIAISTTKGYVTLIETRNLNNKIDVRVNEAEEYYAICFDPFSKMVFFTDYNGNTVYSYDIYNRQLTSRFHTPIVSGKISELLCIKKHGNYELVTGHDTGHICRLMAVVNKEYPIDVTAIDDSKVLRSSASQARVVEVIKNKTSECYYLRQRHLTSGRSLNQVKLDFKPHCIGMHPHKALLAIGFQGDNCKIVFYAFSTAAFLKFEISIPDTDLGADLIINPWTYRYIEVIAFSNDGVFFACAYNVFNYRIYRMVFDGELVSPQIIYDEKCNERIWSLTFSPDSQWLAIGLDKGIKYFPVNSGTIYLQKMNSAVLDIKFNVDGKLLITNASHFNEISRDFSLFSTSIDDGIQLIYTFKGHADEVRCVALSSQGDFIVSGGKDKELIFWGLPTQKELKNFMNNQQLHDELILYKFNNYFVDVIEHLYFDAEGCLIVSDLSGVISRWRVAFSKTENKFLCDMLWCSSNPNLCLAELVYDNVVGLSQDNKILFSQLATPTFTSRVHGSSQDSHVAQQTSVFAMQHDIGEIADDSFCQSEEDLVVDEGQIRAYTNIEMINSYYATKDLGISRQNSHSSKYIQFNEKHLFEAVVNNQVDEVIKFISIQKDKPDLNYNGGWEGDGSPLLTRAISDGSARIARILIEAGADVNLGNDGSVREKFMVNTPLNCAIEREIVGSIYSSNQTAEDTKATNGLVQLLLIKGANPNANSPIGTPPLQRLFWWWDRAVEKGRLYDCRKLFALLIEYGATDETLELSKDRFRSELDVMRRDSANIADAELSKDDYEVLDFSNELIESVEDVLEAKINNNLDYEALKKIAEAVRVPFPSEHETNNIIYRIASLIINFQIDQNINDMADAIKMDMELQRCLLVIVKSSGMFLENILNIEIVASKAITILNESEISFSGMDLSGISIPDANLNGAICEATNFSNADLTNVSLEGAWLNHAQFTNAQMQGVEFGELPSLEIKYLDKSNNGSISCIAYTIDDLNEKQGKWLAIGADNNIELYDLQTKKIIKTLKIPTKGHIISMAFSPDGNLLAAAVDKVIWLWSNIESPNPFSRQIKGHIDRVDGLAFSPNSKLLATISDDKTIQIWRDLEQKNPGLVQKITDFKYGISCIEFSPDGKLLASGGIGSGTLLWSDLEGAQPSSRKLDDESTIKIAFSSDGGWLAAGRMKDNGKCTLVLWSDFTTENPTSRRLLEHTEGVTSLAFSLDSQLLAVGSDDMTICIWDNLEQTIPTSRILYGHTSRVNKVIFGADGNSLISCGDNNVRFWKIARQANINFRSAATVQAGGVDSVAWSPDGKLLASVGVYKPIRLWSSLNQDKPTSRELTSLGEGSSGGNDVVFSPDNKVLAVSGGWSKHVEVWYELDQPSPRMQELSVHGYLQHVESVAFSPDNKFLAAVGMLSGKKNGGALLLWEYLGQAVPKFLCVLGSEMESISCVTFSPDAKILACDDKNGARIWKLDQLPRGSGQKLTGHKGAAQCISFSSNSKLMATGGGYRDKNILLWSELEKSKPKVKKLLGHQYSVDCVAFSPDDKLLATAGGDNTFRLWNPENGIQLGIVQVVYKINSLCWKGNTIATGANDGAVSMWNINKISYIDEGGIHEHKHPSLMWRAGAYISLIASGCVLNGADLNLENKTLLEQRGAKLKNSGVKIGPPLLFSNNRVTVTYYTKEKLNDYRVRMLRQSYQTNNIQYTVDELRQQGIKYYENKAYAFAINTLETALELNKIADYSTVNQEQAELEATTSAETVADILFYIALSNFLSGDLVNAKKCLEEVIRLSPQHASAHQNLGCCYNIEKNYVQAKLSLERACLLNPCSSAYSDYGHFLVQQKEWGTAIIYLEKALEIQDSDAIMYGLIDSKIIDVTLRGAIDHNEHNEITIDAKMLARYLLIQCHYKINNGVFSNAEKINHLMQEFKNLYYSEEYNQDMKELSKSSMWYEFALNVTYGYLPNELYNSLKRNINKENPDFLLDNSEVSNDIDVNQGIATPVQKAKLSNWRS